MNTYTHTNQVSPGADKVKVMSDGSFTELGTRIDLGNHSDQKKDDNPQDADVKDRQRDDAGDCFVCVCVV
jgi:hypothetical protein